MYILWQTSHTRLTRAHYSIAAECKYCIQRPACDVTNIESESSQCWAIDESLQSAAFLDTALINGGTRFIYGVLMCMTFSDTSNINKSTMIIFFTINIFRKNSTGPQMYNVSLGSRRAQRFSKKKTKETG